MEPQVKVARSILRDFRVKAQTSIIRFEFDKGEFIEVNLVFDGENDAIVVRGSREITLEPQAGNSTVVRVAKR